MSIKAAEQKFVYDPSDPAIMADPFPVYDRLREEDPVHWSPYLKAWVITRYADVRDLLLSDNLSVNRLTNFYRNLPPREAVILKEIIHYLNLWLVFRDPPDHTRLRRIMRHAFTAEAIEQMRPNIEDISQILLNRLDRNSTNKVDLIGDYASRLPAYVIMDLLGVPRDMMDDFKKWSDDMSVFIGGARNSLDKYERAAGGCKNMAAYFQKLIKERQENPRPGFLMDLINANEEGDRLSDDELIASCILVLFAGHETTTNLIGNAVRLMLEYPDQLEQLLANPDLIDCAIEEVMRFDGPTNALVRVVAQDHEFYGKQLNQGERVFVLVNSANRDPRAFEAPEIFDIRREQNRHLTFGQGIHVCMGAKLAREEGKVALQALLNRFPNMVLDPEDRPDWIDAMVPRGMSRLPVVIKPSHCDRSSTHETRNF